MTPWCAVILHSGSIALLRGVRQNKGRRSRVNQALVAFTWTPPIQIGQGTDALEIIVLVSLGGSRVWIPLRAFIPVHISGRMKWTDYGSLVFACPPARSMGYILKLVGEHCGSTTRSFNTARPNTKTQRRYELTPAPSISDTQNLSPPISFSVFQMNVFQEVSPP